MIIGNLKRKIYQLDGFTEEELVFMLENIGHENPEIRDELIYGLFCEGFAKELFSIEQANTVIQYLLQNNLLLKDMDKIAISSTLVRSFSALTLALIIYYDDQNASKYYRILTAEERDRIFQSGAEHIANERDATGYLAPYGWVHTIAHSSELLLAIAGHSLVNEKITEDILNGIYKMFIKQTEVFRDREEKRIGLVLIEMLEKDRLSITGFISWINQFAEYYETSKLKEVKDFRSKENVANMLNFIWLLIGEEEVREGKEAVKGFNTF